MDQELGPFVPDSYVLPACRLGLGAFLQYRPSVGGSEAEVVRQELEQHLSVLNISVSSLSSLKSKKFIF